MSIQKLATLRISSIILRAARMKNNKPQALGNDLNFDLKKSCSEGWKKSTYIQAIFAFVIFQHLSLLLPVLGRGQSRKAKIPRELP